MKWSMRVLTAALVALTAACGTNSPRQAAHTSAAAASAATPIPDLRDELLGFLALPSGWSVVPSRHARSGGLACIADPTSGLKAERKAVVNFQYGSGFPVLVEELFYFPGQGQKAMADWARAMSGCGPVSITSVTGGNTFTGTVGALSFPAVGDQSAAWQISLAGTVSGESVSIGYDIVVFRKASTVAVILYSYQGAPDIRSLRILVDAAASRVP